VQELGIALLAKRGVRLQTASGDDLTDSDDLGRKMMRQVAGAFMECRACCRTSQEKRISVLYRTNLRQHWPDRSW